MTQAGPASFQEPVFFTMINWSQLPRKRGTSGVEEEYSDPVGSCTVAMELGGFYGLRPWHLTFFTSKLFLKIYP